MTADRTHGPSDGRPEAPERETARRGSAWHEDDEFWIAAGSAIFQPARWEEAAEQSEVLPGLLGLRPGAHILDLGCGPGRYAIPLAGQGYRVTAVDSTAAFVEEGRRRAEAAGVEVEFVQADMRRFARPEAFDATINMLTSFGYFEDPEDDRLVVDNIRASLVDGGAFLIDTYGKEVIARIFQARDWEERNGELWLYERRVDAAWSHMVNRWIRVTDEGRTEFHLSHRLFSATELERLMLEGGFSSARSYGDLAGEPYDENASRLVVVGRK
jgi:SAM-dependent methyltransferase